MNFLRTAITAAAVTLLIGTATVPAPVSAQRSSGCTQETAGGGGANANQRGGRSDSGAVLVGVIAAAIQNVSVLSDINAAISALNGSNVQVVCLNDVLNQNDIRILNDLLAGSTILSDNLNNSLNNNDILTNVLTNANIALLNNVQVVSVDVGSGDIFVLQQR